MYSINDGLIPKKGVRLICIYCLCFQFWQPGMCIPHVIHMFTFSNKLPLSVKDNDEMKVMFVLNHIYQKPFSNNKIYLDLKWISWLPNGFWSMCLNTNITSTSSSSLTFSVGWLINLKAPTKVPNWHVNCPQLEFTLFDSAYSLVDKAKFMTREATFTFCFLDTMTL